MSETAPRVVVSVVMPTYNVAAFLPLAIDSVLAQDFQDWELIVVDDASTDDTTSILGRYTDTRIRVHRMARNAGRATARNAAIRLARGRYIAIFDSDDVSTSDRLSKQVGFLDAHPDIDGVSSQFLTIWETGTPQPGERFPQTPEGIRRRFERGQMGMAHGASMLRASCFERCGLYCPELPVAEDFELLLRMQRVCRFQTLPEPLLHYRHPGRLPAVRDWLIRARFHRYALHRSGLARVRPAVVPFRLFARRWHVIAALFTVDLARYVYYAIRTRVAPGYSLR